jgi:TonB family protein
MIKINLFCLINPKVLLSLFFILIISILYANGQSSPTQPYLFVDQKPTFPEGEQALQEYLARNIRYPTEALENSIEGTVVLQFVVDADGSISAIKTMRDLVGGCTEEAIRVVKSMPKWNAGMKDGNAVPTWVNLPVTFKLATSPTTISNSSSSTNVGVDTKNVTIDKTKDFQTISAKNSYIISSSQDTLLMSVMKIGRQYNKSTIQYNTIDLHNYFNFWSKPVSSISNSSFDKDNQMKLISDSKIELDLILAGLDSLQILESYLKAELLGYDINPDNNKTNRLTIEELYFKLKNAKDVYKYTYKDQTKWTEVLDLVQKDCGLNENEFFDFRTTFFKTYKNGYFFYKDLECDKLDKKIAKFLKKGIIYRFTDNERISFIEKLTGLDDRYFDLKKQLQDTEKTIKYTKNKYVLALGNSSESFTYLGPLKNNVPNGFGYLIAKDKKHILSALWSNGVPTTVFEINIYHSANGYWNSGVRYRVDDVKLGQSGFIVEIMALNYKDSGKSTYNIYLGNFKKSDKIYLSGFGVCFYESYKSDDINYYQGYWNESKKSGNGTYFSESTYTGSFLLDEFVNGTRVLPNGDKHIGDFGGWKLQGVGEIVYAGGERQKGYYENGIMTQTYEQYETSRIEQEKALQLQQDIDNANYFRKEYAEKIKEDMYALVYKSAIFGEELGKEKMVEFVEKIARDYLSRTPTEQDVKVIMEIIKETAAEIQFLAKLMKSADNGNTNGGIASSSFSEKDDLLQSSSNRSYSNHKKTKNEHVFICTSGHNEECCKTVVVTSSSSPKSSGCCPRTDGRGCVSGHSWADCGESGSRNYQCSSCGITVRTASQPNSSCCPVNNCGYGHYWNEIE